MATFFRRLPRMDYLKPGNLRETLELLDVEAEPVKKTILPCFTGPKASPQSTFKTAEPSQAISATQSHRRILRQPYYASEQRRFARARQAL